MIVGVARYLVTLLPGALDKAGAALGHLADEEECAVRTARLESVKKPGRVAARGAVIEGERNELISVGARRYRQNSHKHQHCQKRRGKFSEFFHFLKPQFDHIFVICEA